MKKYTVSTMEFSTIKEAEAQLQKWLKEGNYNWKSKVYEIKEVYVPKIKLIKEK